MTTHERIKLALDIHSRIQNIKAIDSELTKYNLPVLQKSAALGAHKEERIKLAALLQQRALEKQALLGQLVRGGAKMLGKGMQAGKGLMRGAGKMGVQGARRAGSYAKNNPGSAAALAGGGALAGTGLGALAMNPATQLNKTINSGMNQVGGMYDKGMAMLGGFGQGLGQGAQSLMNMPGALASTLQKGFTGQLGQQMPQRGMLSYGRSNSPQGATPGIAPPQQAMGAR
jgi:hypothetical protein